MTTEERINSEKNVLVKMGRDHGRGGNHFNHENAGRKDHNNLSPFMRTLIAAATKMDTAPAAAKTFGVSKAHAHNLKHGYVTRQNGKDSSLVQETRKVLDEVHKKAADIVMDCLGLVTPEKIREIETVREVVSVAKDVASIAEKAAPPEQKNQGNYLNVKIYAPGQIDIGTFDVIEVEAKEIA